MQTKQWSRQRLGERIETRLADADAARVAEMAAREGTTVSAVLRRLVRAGLAAESQPRNGRAAKVA